MMFQRIRMCALLLPLALASTASLAATSPSSTLAKDCTLASPVQGLDSIGPSAKPPFPPVQIDISVPLEPTLFPSGGLSYLVYELHFQNYTDEPVALQELEIVDASSTPGVSIATFTGPQLHERLRPIGADKLDEDHPLEGGKRAVAFICVAFDSAGRLPERLGHRVRVSGAVAEGPTIATRNTQLKVLAPPVMGTSWIADNGPSLKSHHRTGLFVAGGRAHISRRYAIDWKQEDEQSQMYSGDALDVHSYYSYGERVYAVADALVISAVDGIPDNTPRTAAGFKTAVPITMETVAGNAIVLDLGDGQFAYYAHLKPGSVRVKKGDHVKRGEWLGQIGNSGDARWPHLHFQVTIGPDILASEGVPFLIDRYRSKVGDGAWQTRTHEYPIGDAAVEFVMDAATPPK